MSIPKNITKEVILKAINEINENDIPDKRLSKEYYLKHEGKTLPPKYVISIANKFVNEIELDSKLFNAVEAKNFLKKMDFKINYNEALSPKRFWIEKTIVKGRLDREKGERALGRTLWSPLKDKRGADIYKNMRHVQKGDLVLHLIDNKEISGISIVKKGAIETNGVKGTDWEGPSYLITLEDYTELNPKIDRGDLLIHSHINELKEISKNSEVFYNNKLELRQGAYLTPCPKKLLSLINQIYYSKSKSKLPHTNDQQLEVAYLPDSKSFDINSLQSDVDSSGLLFNQKTLSRFVASLTTKPFVILSGLSGSGKTKLAQAFAQWICHDENQYCLVPVGADWTNREPLLGYPNALNTGEYVKPENGVLDLIIHAHHYEELPHFLILDEMNLSHVERYFADFLSVMETKGSISLHANDEEKDNVPAKINLPSNVFIVGTVNIDETTYMFSPKVLDRANVIEFRITKEEIEEYLNNPKELDMERLEKQGANMAKSFVKISRTGINKDYNPTEINEILVDFFKELKKTGAEFGYRSAGEIFRLIGFLGKINAKFTTNDKIDIAIMQKLLPKLHGSRRKLCPVLITLGNFCIQGSIDNIEKEVFSKNDFDFEDNEKVKYPLSLEKITRMFNGAVDNGFASYAEA